MAMAGQKELLKIPVKQVRRALEKWKRGNLMNTRVTVVGSGSSSQILD